MASGTIGDSSDDLSGKGRSRWSENSIVYTRKLFRKARKSADKNNTATTSEDPAAAGPTSTTAEDPTPSPTPAKVSSPTLAPAASTEAPTTSAAEGPNNSAAVSLSATDHGSPAAVPGSPRNAVDNVVQASLEALETEDAVSSRQSSQEQSPSHRLPEIDADSSFKQPEQLQEQNPSEDDDSTPNEGRSTGMEVDSSFKQPQQLQEQHLLEDDDSTQNEVREGGGSGTAELQIFENPALPNSSEAQDLEKHSPVHGSNELQQTSGDGLHSLRESPPQSIDTDLPNGREDAGEQLQVGNEPENDGEPVPVPTQVSSGNEPANVNGVVKPLVISRLDDRIRFNLSKETAKDEIKDLRKKLESELEQVRSLVKQLEAKELQIAAYDTEISNRNLSNVSNYIGMEVGNVGSYSLPQPQHTRADIVDRRALVRMNSEVGGVMGHQETRPVSLARVNSDVGSARHLEPRPYNRQLSVAVMENNHRGGEYVEKEKRTPKANQYYRNSEFLLGKDRLPSESNKRQKTNNGRRHSGESDQSFGFGFGFDKSKNQLLKSCSSLLQRLMKHKFGWVFNEPVDAKALGLVDYHDIIKHPMDLGTIKSRLSQNWYKTPREFAEDVRLVFRNAMTYNPKGQDVHTMAEQLSQMFEERWAVIEAEYNPYWKYQMYQDAGLPTPTSRRAPPSHFTPGPVPIAAPAHPGFIPAVVQAPGYVPLYAAPQMRTLDRPETMMTPMAIDPKFHRPHVGRTPVPKKPKAKDPNKRDMTYDEKQRLSTNLQSLPSEKLDAIVQIIKKRNTTLNQHDDEIEVDIDNVDPETLWELDRFVTNYKKSLSKYKRKAELALQARTAANQTVVVKNTSAAGGAVQTESGAAFEKRVAPPASQGQRQGDNGSRSSSSSSSSSDSGSSSSDSDSDSSSADGSDAGHSPKT